MNVDQLSSVSAPSPLLASRAARAAEESPLPLTLTHAGVAAGHDIGNLGDWLAASRKEFASGERSGMRSLTEWLYWQSGHLAEVVCAPQGEPHELLQRKFRLSTEATQLQLALEALQRVVAARTPAHSSSACRLTLFAGTSFDESTWLQSAATRLAAAVGSSQHPHFAVSQLQSAALGGALCIIDALLETPGANALFVAAERWPAPFPRCWGLSGVLGDGAVALWFARQHAAGLRYAGGVQLGTQPFLRELPRSAGKPPQVQIARDAGARRTARPAPLSAAASAAASQLNRALTIDAAAVIETSVAVLREFLEAHGLRAADLHGWISPGFDLGIEAAVSQALAISPEQIVGADSDAGHWCSAATPAGLARVLSDVHAGGVPDGALFLSWGACFSGSIGAELWCASSGDAARAGGHGERGWS